MTWGDCIPESTFQPSSPRAMEVRGYWPTLLICAFGLCLAIAAALLLQTGQNQSLLVLCLILIAVLFPVIGSMAIGAFRAQRQALLDEVARETALEAQVVQQRAAVDTLADGLDIGILVCDGKAIVQYANRKAEELFRFEDAIGKSILAVTISYDLEQIVLTAIGENRSIRTEITIPFPEERVAIAEAWPDITGRRAFLSLYDITSLRKLERIRQDFVANVSHELRTPLASIRAMAETLADSGDDVELRAKYLDRIIDEVDRLGLISEDLLILSAAESNPVRRQSVDVAGVFRTATSQLKPKAGEKGLVLNFEGPKALLIAANAIQLTQVAMNLIENAIKYTHEGQIDVSVSQVDDSACIAVTDTGIGIGSEHLDRIFERFYRVDRGRSRSSGGTGLGLSIVKHIVEAHGGSVEVQSELGKGTTIRVCLPVGDLTGEADSAQ